MKIKIERLEIELPGLAESVIDYNLEALKSDNESRNGMIRTILTLLQEALNKLVVTSSSFDEDFPHIGGDDEPIVPPVRRAAETPPEES